jgi:hypothetical protein
MSTLYGSSFCCTSYVEHTGVTFSPRRSTWHVVKVVMMSQGHARVTAV